MIDDTRAQRITEYQARSREADRLVRNGKVDEARAIWHECGEQAAAAGDEDYRQFFAAEAAYLDADSP
jgi:hypothetical protein